MSHQTVDEMTNILKEAYESEYQRYHRQLYRTAVECHGKGDWERRIIKLVDDYRNRLLGQLDIIQAVGGATEPTVPEFLEEQGKRLHTEFTSYELFGIKMESDEADRNEHTSFQRLILGLKLQCALSSNPLKRMKVRKHILWLGKAERQKVDEKLSERIVELTYKGKLSSWEIRYLETVLELLKTFV